MDRHEPGRVPKRRGWDWLDRQENAGFVGCPIKLSVLLFLQTVEVARGGAGNAEIDPEGLVLNKKQGFSPRSQRLRVNISFLLVCPDQRRPTKVRCIRLRPFFATERQEIDPEKIHRFSGSEVTQNGRKRLKRKSIGTTGEGLLNSQWTTESTLISIDPLPPNPSSKRYAPPSQTPRNSRNRNQEPADRCLQRAARLDRAAPARSRYAAHQ